MQRDFSLLFPSKYLHLGQMMANLVETCIGQSCAIDKITYCNSDSLVNFIDSVNARVNLFSVCTKQYHIEIRSMKMRTWSITKSDADLREIDNHLRNRFTDLPSFPSEINNCMVFLEIETYLNMLLKRRTLFQCIKFIQFLEAPYSFLVCSFYNDDIIKFSQVCYIYYF
jgi:hypothetical protein